MINILFSDTKKKKRYVTITAVAAKVWDYRIEEIKEKLESGSGGNEPRFLRVKE